MPRLKPAAQPRPRLDRLSWHKPPSALVWTQGLRAAQAKGPEGHTLPGRRAGAAGQRGGWPGQVEGVRRGSCPERVGLSRGAPRGSSAHVPGRLGRFKATLWLSEEHPLSLGDQVTPIIDLMAISNAHFAKLRDFITLRLPPGFPVKIGERAAGQQGDGRRRGVHGGQAQVAAALRLSFPPRDSAFPRAQRPHHLRQPVRLRRAAELRVGAGPRLCRRSSR